MLVPVKAQLNSTATEMVILNVRQSTKSLNPKRTMLKKNTRFRTHILHLHQSTPNREAVFARRGTARLAS
jgi:hypothetical protein